MKDKYRVVLLALLTIAGVRLAKAQKADTLYIYETVIEYDTLITRDTTYVHDTIRLSYNRQKPAGKDHRQKQKSDCKPHEESPVLEELFQGFHLGYIGQFDLMMPAQLSDAMMPMQTTNDPYLFSVPRAGGHAGLEFSYHFARWFGVSAALNYGTTGALRLKFYWQEGSPEMIKRNYLYATGLSVPVKFEFHYPISPKAWAVVDAGVRIRMPWNTFIYGYDRDHSAMETENNSSDYGEQLSEDNPLILNYNYIDRNILNLDVLTSVGMYFRLRNNDLLRWNVGFNMALEEFAIGSYTHRIYNNMSGVLPPEDPYRDILGDFSLRSHYFYAQIAYIHTFKNSKQRQETAPYALRYGNNKMYNHEIKLEVSDPLGYTILQSPQYHAFFGYEPECSIESKTYVPIFSAGYHYRVLPWFWIGASINYGYTKDNVSIRYTLNDPLAFSLVGTQSYHLIGILPDIRFSYFNRPHVTLYSALSVGVVAHIRGKYEGDEAYKDYYTHSKIYSAFQATLFGVKAGGNHWFGSFELGAGYKGVASLGVGYEF